VGGDFSRLNPRTAHPMNLRLRPNWHLLESAATDEEQVRAFGQARRRLLLGLGAGVVGAALGSVAQAATEGFPSKKHPVHAGKGLKVTPEALATSYNNFYEFGTGKGDPKEAANKGWRTEPWTIELAGEINNPGRWDIDKLIARMGGLEQRVYRHRCVEAWSMVIPWDGFPLAGLVALAEPKASAHYLRLVSFFDPEQAPGQRESILDWPYVEGLRMDEAVHPLAFIATGMYGRPLPNQNGAPLRLVVPWKYGFKGIISIVRIDFMEQQPKNTWERMAPREYGFYANVNPEVDHPRWSQASERIIGAGFFAGKQPTLPFNGYAEEVAALYAGMDLRVHF